jgi:hypothetical protein
MWDLRVHTEVRLWDPWTAGGLWRTSSCCVTWLGSGSGIANGQSWQRSPSARGSATVVIDQTTKGRAPLARDEHGEGVRNRRLGGDDGLLDRGVVERARWQLVGHRPMQTRAPSCGSGQSPQLPPSEEESQLGEGSGDGSVEGEGSGAEGASHEPDAPAPPNAPRPPLNSSSWTARFPKAIETGLNTSRSSNIILLGAGSLWGPAAMDPVAHRRIPGLVMASGR